MAKFQELDVVRVIQLLEPKTNEAATQGAKRSPKIGDRGCVVACYNKPSEGYCVESIREDGMTVWLVDFLPEELEAI